MKPERIGIYGGSFSPPHVGHRHAAEAFLEAEKPDKLLIMPASIPPHKALLEPVNGEIRAELCRLNFEGLRNTEICDLELRRAGKSYTYLTLEELSAKDRTLILLCGTDMFLTLDTWREPEKIFNLAEIVCIRREADATLTSTLENKKKEFETRFSATVRFLNDEAVLASSTDIRSRLKTGADTSELLMPKVREYIEKCNLYK